MNLKQQKSSKLHDLQLSKQATCRHFPFAICPQIVFSPEPLPDHSWPSHIHTPKRKGIFLFKKLQQSSNQQTSDPHIESTHPKYINLKPRSLSQSKMKLEKQQSLQSNQSTQIKTASKGYLTDRSYIKKQQPRQQKILYRAPKSLIFQKYPVKQNKISIYQGREHPKISYLSQNQAQGHPNIGFLNNNLNLLSCRPNHFERSAVSTGLPNYRFMSKSIASQGIIPSLNFQMESNQKPLKQSSWSVLKKQIRQFKDESPDKASQQTKSDPNSSDSIRVSHQLQKLDEAREVNTIVSDDYSGFQSKTSSRVNVQPLKVSMVIGNDINEAGFWD